MDGLGKRKEDDGRALGRGQNTQEESVGKIRSVESLVTCMVQGSQGHQGLTWDVFSLTDGELGPFDRLKNLPALCCFQTNLAEVHSLILLFKVQDFEDSGCLRLCPVQDKPVLEMLMDETRGRVVDKFPMEVLPSPENHHLWVWCQLPGEVEGEGDLDGAALDTKDVWFLVKPIWSFSVGSC